MSIRLEMLFVQYALKAWFLSFFIFVFLLCYLFLSQSVSTVCLYLRFTGQKKTSLSVPHNSSQFSGSQWKTGYSGDSDGGDFLIVFIKWSMNSIRLPPGLQPTIVDGGGKKVTNASIMGPRAEKKILISLYINLCINLEFYFGNDLQTHLNKHEGPAKSGKMLTDFYVLLSCTLPWP